jgi:SHS2 domain-containing protein
MQGKNWDFKILENHATGDFEFEASGSTLGDLFISCANACFAAMTELETVKQDMECNIEINGDNPNDLLFNFISELIYLKDFKKMFFSRFDIVISPDEKSLNAAVFGERINYGTHVIKTDVKAVTYHDLDIKHEKGRFTTRMILDL